MKAVVCLGSISNFGCSVDSVHHINKILEFQNSMNSNLP